MLGRVVLLWVNEKVCPVDPVTLGHKLKCAFQDWGTSRNLSLLCLGYRA
jgi:hypothetical protein